MAIPRRSTASSCRGWWRAVIPSARFAASSNGTCGGSKPARAEAVVTMHIVDRRLNPGSKSLENRQRFLRRAKALVQGAVKKTSQDRDIKDVLEGGEVSIPLDGMNEPRFHREGGTRDMVLPGNKKFIEGDMLPRSGQGGGKGSGPGEGDSEDAFRFVLSRDEFVDLFLDDLELPDLAKRKLAEAESEGLRRAGYAT